MSDIEKRYDELEEAILTLNMQINESTDKCVKEILISCKDNLENELNEIKDRVESIWKNEKRELENEYWRSAVK
mgnify:CR=1 FL=1|nr:MAG TPA: protein of unknown function (DUF5320) [Caudoviricetes sp.]